MNHYVKSSRIDQTMNLMSAECELIIWLYEWHIVTKCAPAISRRYPYLIISYLIPSDVFHKEFFLKKFSGVLYIFM